MQMCSAATGVLKREGIERGKNNMVDFPALSTFHLSSSTLRRSSD